MGSETELISMIETTITGHWPDKEQDIDGVPTLRTVATDIAEAVRYVAFPQRVIQGDGPAVIDASPAVKYVHTIHAPQSIVDRLIAGEDMLEMTREEFFDTPGEWTALGVDADTAQRFAAIGSAAEDGPWI
ncbi:hypothetical protein [Mycobacteroides abscessus]|uniref:hypothetical protein n=1 Tax=Mycobacteroides abscessus TaxID=36809 RepID=UPI000927221A|nr:hypothetical protein [Mycobacteroides abscessus]DAZ90222.1 TPA_asm: hypothetical protein PROPHIFSIL01-1_35 [Mycobacterium phage prophiFSIL01-1]SHZ91831.1 Uncharacterised protein [Mycobacteroides abscessus subsp. abscessus]SIA08111.1 Uncharacterised protein [Mycobacteroides abscessus subsp. abscessus]SIA65871.1 Uncharacterised protein [Mycobacteroides abscessus subsp. abscessus]SIA71042.1 Uncharacterised protein [Mycobacteroides abscessus subsp. abscessus]